MKKIIPDFRRKPSTQAGIAAVTGKTPSVIVQDESGNQIVVTPKLARVLSEQLSQMADIADGGKPDVTPSAKGNRRKIVPFIRPSSPLVM